MKKMSLIKNKKRSSLIVLCFFIFISSCNSKKFKTKDDQNNLTAQALEKPSYQDVYQNVVSPRCLFCHSSAGGNRGGINLETYEQTFQVIKSLEQAVLIDQVMPPASQGLLTDFQKTLIKNWIAQGAPEYSDQNSTVPVKPPILPIEPPGNSPEPIEATWTEITNKIFKTRCLECHGVDASISYIPIADYQFIVDPTNDIIKIGRSAESRLYIDINRTGRGRMPPLSSGPALTPLEIEAIKRWIDAGALNN